MSERTEIAVGSETAQGLAAGTPTLERGAVAELTFLFIPAEGSTSFKDGTLFADGTVFGNASDIVSTYRTVRERLEFADAVVRRGRSIEPVPYVRERVPDRAPIDSQIVLIKPSDDINSIDPFWAAVVGGTDESSNEFGVRRLTLELFVLADGSRYGSRSELEDDLASEVI